MDFYLLIGYVSGLLFIKPDMEPASLWPTVALVHILDAILCGVVANHSGRNKFLWTVSGLSLRHLGPRRAVLTAGEKIQGQLNFPNRQVFALQ